MIRLHLVRHGQASFDSDDYDQLSALGTRQADCLGQWWRAQGLSADAVWHGGMRRHLQTAQGWQAAQASSTPPLQIHPGLREFDHREVFFAHRPDLRDAAALQAWKAAPGDYALRFADTYAQAQARWLAGMHPADYTESWTAVSTRVLAALVELSHALQPLARQQGTADALVFTSAGPISAVIQQLRQWPVDRVATLQSGLHNAGVTVLHLAAPEQIATWQLAAVDRTAHLDALGVAASHR